MLTRDIDIAIFVRPSVCLSRFGIDLLAIAKFLAKLG